MSGYPVIQTSGLCPLAPFLCQGFGSDQLPVGVRFETWATGMQHATVPGRNTARWARDGGQLSIGQPFRDHCIIQDEVHLAYVTTLLGARTRSIMREPRKLTSPFPG